jgi:hypothetical protein
MFPAQDVLQKRGIGNLIALPLQGESGKNGTTLFVDQNFNPYEKQFEALAGVSKIPTETIMNLYQKFKKHKMN